MTARDQVLFLGLETYGRLGGIQRFNQRLIRALIEVRGADRVRGIFMRDTAKDIPADLAGQVEGFGPRRGAFIRAALKQAPKADRILLGHINLLPLGLLLKLRRPSARLILMVHGDEVWNRPPYRRTKWWEPWLARSLDRVASGQRLYR